jgi:flagellin-like protein
MKTINTNDDRPRGQVGIGTLIIFIAMVLVAAVAAGVLVNTSGLLQSQAEDTGADAQAQISNQIEVVTATGVARDGTDGVEKIELVVKKSAGSDPIDLSQASIQYTSDSASETLTYLSGSGDATADQFNTTDLKDVGSTSSPSEVLDANGDRVKITVAAGLVQGSDIAEGKEVTLRIVDQSGATTVYGVNVPDTLGSQNYVLV